MAIELGPSELITPVCRLSFPALFEPRAVAKDKPDEKKYQATILIPAGESLKPFHKAMEHVMREKWGKLFKLSARNNPIHDCAEKPELDGYEAGWHFIGTSSKYQPQLLDRQKKEVLDPELFYPGCWVRLFCNAYAWDHPQGGKGISFGLNAVQWVEHGDRLDGRKDASEIFEALEVPDDDAPPEDRGEESPFG